MIFFTTSYQNKEKQILSFRTDDYFSMRYQNEINVRNQGIF